MSLVVSASVAFLVLVGVVGGARVGGAGGCAVLRDPVSAVGDALSAVVVPGVPVRGRVEMTRAVPCTDVAFVVIVTVVTPGVVFVFSAAVLFKIPVVTEPVPTEAVLAVVVLTAPGLKTCVDVEVVWLTACAAVVAEWRAASCARSAATAGKEARSRGAGTSVSVPAAAAADAGSGPLSAPAAVPSVTRLFTELVVTEEVPSLEFAEGNSAVFVVLGEAAVVSSGEKPLTKSDVAGLACTVKLSVKVMVVSVLLASSVVLVIATAASVSVVFCVFSVKTGGV